MDRKELLNEQLKIMGLEPGDTVLVNFDMPAFGKIQGFKRADYVDFLLRYLGDEGTLVTLAYTDYKFSLCNSGLPIFHINAPANTGAFANIMLKNKSSFRSLHPTNSIVAIGKNAKSITENIDKESLAFEFYRKFLEYDAKVLLVGCKNFPGFITHLAELELGLYKKYWFGRFIKCRLENGQIFKRVDPGGCSVTFDRLYPFYIKEEKLKIGVVGNAYSLSISAKDAYEIDTKVLNSNPGLIECERPDCFKCRVGKWNTIWFFPVFLFYKIMRKLKLKLRF